MKELFKEVETHMKHAVDHFHHELKHLRTGRASPGAARRDHRRLLRQPGAAQPGRQPLGGRRVDDRGAAVRPQPELGDRAGHHEVRPGAEPVVGRQDHPHPGAAADRGAPQGDRQEGPRPRRARADRRPPGPPRGQRQAQEDGEGQGDQSGRRAPRAWTRSRSSTTATSARSPRPSRRKSSRSWRSEPPAALSVNPSAWA